MGLSPDQVPWYVGGLAFECQQCGRCCAGPEEGYVWVTDAEITQIAAALKMTPEQFRNRHLRRIGGKYTILEHPSTHDCSFLEVSPDGASRRCRIYSVRPRQCRTWPFWALNLANVESWMAAGRRCVGVNRGRLFTPDEIAQRASAPQE